MARRIITPLRGALSWLVVTLLWGIVLIVVLGAFMYLTADELDGEPAPALKGASGGMPGSVVRSG